VVLQRWQCQDSDSANDLRRNDSKHKAVERGNEPASFGENYCCFALLSFSMVEFSLMFQILPSDVPIFFSWTLLSSYSLYNGKV